MKTKRSTKTGVIDISITNLDTVTLPASGHEKYKIVYCNEGILFPFGKPDSGWYLFREDDAQDPEGPFGFLSEAVNHCSDAEAIFIDGSARAPKSVTLLSSGYDWTCLECNTDNHEVEVLWRVKCRFCDSEFDSVVEHATK